MLQPSKSAPTSLAPRFAGFHRLVPRRVTIASLVHPSYAPTSRVDK
jgi:hypothetical protein